jgi:hypothetical protein
VSTRPVDSSLLSTHLEDQPLLYTPVVEEALCDQPWRSHTRVCYQEAVSTLSQTFQSMRSWNYSQTTCSSHHLCPPIPTPFQDQDGDLQVHSIKVQVHHHCKPEQPVLAHLEAHRLHLHQTDTPTSPTHYTPSAPHLACLAPPHPCGLDHRLSVLSKPSKTRQTQKKQL